MAHMYLFASKGYGDHSILVSVVEKVDMVFLQPAEQALQDEFTFGTTPYAVLTLWRPSLHRYIKRTSSGCKSSLSHVSEQEGEAAWLKLLCYYVNPSSQQG